MRSKNRISLKALYKLLVGFLAALSLFGGSARAQNPVPLINQPLVPQSIELSSAGFTLTVNGTGFASGAVVHWNGSPRTTTFVSQAQLKANILTSDIATVETARVTVVNPGPGGGASNVAFFEVTTPTSSVGLVEASYATANRSYAVAVGDFNGDGKLDLAVADYATGTISVLLGNGDGTFQPHVDYATGRYPESVAVGDFNNDGKLDLVVANNGSNTVSILLGNGDGTFQPQVEYATGNLPMGVAAADFNRDGKLDLVVANSGADNVSVLLGNGDGTFQPAVNYAAGTQPQSPAVGDFNRDGKLDLVVANNSTNTINVLLGNGDGTFQPAVNYSTGSGPASVAVADFNGDDKLDLAVASGTGVSVLLGNGDGTFQPHVDYGTGSSNPCSVAVGDFNGDGRSDLVMADLFSTDVHLLLGNGDGTFVAAASYSAGSGSYPSSVAVGDFNGDGRLDVAVADSGSATVSVLLQPTVSLSTPGLTFAEQVVGTRSSGQQIGLTNIGSLNLNIAGISISGINATDFTENNNCPSTLAIGAMCTIDVTFAPTQIGPRIANVTITDNAPNSPQSVGLSGIGVVTGPNVTVSTSSLSFATQLVGTSSSAQTVTLNNYGSTSLSITSIRITGADPADFAETNNCGSSVSSAGSCTIIVTFQPTQRGSRAASLTLTDNAPGSPQAVVLSGSGTVVTLSPSGLSFHCQIQPNTCPPPPQRTTLTNTGGTALSISSITITGSTTFSQTNNCGSSVVAKGSCTITVTFKSSSRGTFSGAVSVSDNGGGGPQQVLLSATETKSGAGALAVRSAMAAHITASVPAPTGPMHVGTGIMDLADSRRDDPLLADGTKRELLVRFWYPASFDQGCEPAEYTSRAVWSYFSQLAEFRLPEVRTNSCADAPVTSGAHPVIVFTHGYTGTFTDYTFLFEDLASRGYVVASIDHTYEATAVEFPDGRFVKSLVGSHLANSWRTDDQSLSIALSVRLDDLRFVLNELERLNTSSDNPFAEKLDLTKIALAGHSLGGLATWKAIQRDARFKAGILLDPYLADGSLGSTETPVMVLAMGHELRSEEECRLWSNLLGPRFSVNLRGAEHLTPSDAVWLAKGTIKSGAMGPDKTIAAVRDYMAAFLDANLRGRPMDPLLTGPSAKYPDADVTTQKQLLRSTP